MTEGRGKREEGRGKREHRNTGTGKGFRPFHNYFYFTFIYD